MKKLLYILIFALIPASIIAQENFYAQTLKELIAIQTLITENRVSELSDFLDKYSYVGGENQSFFKFDLNDNLMPDDIAVMFRIEDNTYLSVVITKKDSDGKMLFNLPKRERNKIWARIVSEIEVGLPYFSFNNLKNTFINKDGEGFQNTDYEIIGRYKFKGGQKGKEPDWKTFIASNFSTLGIDDEEMWRYSFTGPGKVDWIDIRFPKNNDKGWDDEVFVPFFIVPFTVSESYNEKEPINIPFFMSLRNFNDRIWSDN